MASWMAYLVLLCKPSEYVVVPDQVKRPLAADHQQLPCQPNAEPYRSRIGPPRIGARQTGGDISTALAPSSRRVACSCITASAAAGEAP